MRWNAPLMRERRSSEQLLAHVQRNARVPNQRPLAALREGPDVVAAVAVVVLRERQTASENLKPSRWRGVASSNPRFPKCETRRGAWSAMRLVRSCATALSSSGSARGKRGCCGHAGSCGRQLPRQGCRSSRCRCHPCLTKSEPGRGLKG